MDGYLDALSEQSVTVTLAGQAVTVDRARLGLHIRLDALSAEFEAAPGSLEMAEAVRAYFEALGLDIGQAHPAEVLRAFAQLRAFNGWQMSLAFMKGGGPPKEPVTYDYEGRNWAWVVHKLASRYGWSRDEIFSLWPEEAACYLQEVLVSEHHEAEERYSLSELAYHYDKVTGKSHYQPMAKPAWMYSTELPKPVRMLRSMLPFGVKTLDGETVEYHH